jgi:hypothetical protein
MTHSQFGTRSGQGSGERHPSSVRAAELHDRLRNPLAAVLNATNLCHLSIQHNHIHLLVEASDKQALASGMKGFQIPRPST